MDLSNPVNYSQLYDHPIYDTNNSNPCCHFLLNHISQWFMLIYYILKIIVQQDKVIVPYNPPIKAKLNNLWKLLHDYSSISEMVWFFRKLP